MANSTRTHQKDKTPYKTEESETEVLFILNDFQLHAFEQCNPTPLARGVQKAITNTKPFRSYVNNGFEVNSDSGTFSVTISIDGLKEVLDEARVKGKRVRIVAPSDGIPIYLAKDAEEKIASLKHKGLV